MMDDSPKTRNYIIFEIHMIGMCPMQGCSRPTKFGDMKIGILFFNVQNLISKIKLYVCTMNKILSLECSLWMQRNVHDDYQGQALWLQNLRCLIFDI